MALRFLDVEIDPLAEMVRRDGRQYRLRQRTFHVLLYLIEHRHRVVTREELFSVVWNGIAVSDDALVQSIVEIRKALGDDLRAPRFVRTLPKRGYHFVAPANGENDVESTLMVEVETTQSIEYEAAEDVEPRRRWLHAGAIAATLAAALSLAALTIWKRNGVGREHGPSEVVLSGGLTSSLEAYRLYALGVDRANEFRTEEALGLFQRAIALDPEFAMAHARVGYVHGLISSDAETARRHILRADELSHRLTEKDRMLVDAWRAIIDFDFDGAIERFRLIVNRYPTDLESHLRLASLLSGEERLDEAIAVIERARLIDPNSAAVYRTLGLYSLAGRHEESIAATSRYVELRPGEPNAYDSLGLSYHAAGRYDEALAAYSRALTIDSDFDIARYHRAATYVQLGRFRDAVTEVEACQQRAGNDFERGRAFSTLADIYRLQGDLARAADAARRVPSASNWMPLFVSIEEGDLNAADRATETESRKYNSRGVRAGKRGQFNARGYAALRRGEHEKALQYFRDALRFRQPLWYVDPLATGLADAYFELRRFREARDEYSRALTFNPNDARSLFGRARALEELGQRRAAANDYRRFLELWNDADRDARHWIEAQERLARLQ